MGSDLHVYEPMGAVDRTMSPDVELRFICIYIYMCICMYVCIYIYYICMCIHVCVYMYVYMHVCMYDMLDVALSTVGVRPSPPTKSLSFEGFDSNKLLILRGGNYHIHIIV